jgi:hypothetical protein
MTLLTAPDDPQADGAADAFYREHRRAMLLGARALWPARDSVEDLHRFMALQGLGAFRKEKQNDPAPATAGPWSPARWRRFVLRQSTLFPLPDPPAVPPLDQPQAAWPALPPCWPLDQLALYGYLDPATGRPSRSGRLNDYAALITLARTPGPDPFYLVLEAWMAREPLERQVHQVVEAALRWGWHGFAFEANGFQSVLAPELTRALREAALPLGLSPLVPIPVTHSQAKDLRIERAGLLVQNGRLLFHAHLPAEFTQNASDYPQPGAHDDGLDALAAAIELARSRNPHQSQPSIRTIRRSDTRFP